MKKNIFIISDVQYLILLTFYVLFFPQIQGFFGLGLEQFLTFSTSFLCVLFVGTRNNPKLPFSAVLISCAFSIILTISIIRSAQIVISNDYFELFKPIYFLSFFAIGYNISWSNEKLILFFKYLVCFLFIVAFFGILESISIQIDSLFQILYKGSRSVLSSKAVFSFISPYTFGSLLILPIFFSFYMSFSYRNIKYIIMFVIFFICMIFTQSRTSLISFVLTYVVLFVIILFNKWIPFKPRFLKFSFITVGVLIPTIPIIIIMLGDGLSYLIAGISVVISNLSDFEFDLFINSSPSIALRYEQFLYAVEHQDTLPLLGVAIGKGVLMPESFITMYLYRTGIIGIMIHLSFIIYTLINSYKMSKYYLNIDIRISIFFISIFTYFISFFFSYFSSSINDQTRTGFLFYILIAITSSFKRNYKITNSNG